MKEELRVEATEVFDFFWLAFTRRSLFNLPMRRRASHWCCIRSLIFVTRAFLMMKRGNCSSTSSMLIALFFLLQVVVAACEKYPGKFDVAAKMIKEASLYVIQV
jgi:hypothetical protein